MELIRERSGDSHLWTWDRAEKGARTLVQVQPKPLRAAPSLCGTESLIPEAVSEQRTTAPSTADLRVVSRLRLL